MNTLDCVWNDRLRLWDEFLRSREEFKVATKQHSISLSEFRRMTKRQYQIGETVVNFSTREAGRIVRIVENRHIWSSGQDGLSYIVAVPSVSPKREELWSESDICHAFGKAS